MDRLQAMEVFTRVVEMSSFSRAADALALSRTSATTIIQNLEAHLHVRLLQRTTRKLKLTPEGAEYYERCVRILAEIAETEVALTSSGKGPRGKLRIDMPGVFGKWIVTPRLHTFQQRYPDLELMVGHGDKMVDMIQDGVDCVIRAGELEDSSLIARKLTDMHMLTVASPGYLAQHGLPRSLADLDHHSAIHYISNRTGRPIDLNFIVDGTPTEVRMQGKIGFNDAEAYVTYGLSGMGILQPPRFMVLEHLRTGALVEILPQWRPRSLPVSAVYPQNRHLAPKVRVFVDWIAEVFEKCPLMSADNVPATTLAPAGVPQASAMDHGMVRAIPPRPARVNWPNELTL
jgi:LysR family transcriptional regulator for bpeEF and oprC